MGRLGDRGEALKRFYDIFFSVLGLVLLFIPIIVLMILIRSKIGSPVFFQQIRPGQFGKPFKMIKFRTMTNEYGRDGRLLADANRMTNFGRWLRSTSLDELPELWNVLKGDMSLVGPRPLLLEYLHLYTPEQARRHEVKPGITGWAQVNGRNNISWAKKFEMDVWYVDHQSLLLDLKIIILTVGQVIKRVNVTKDGLVTTDFFNGNN